jgi:hypothetical protein
MTTAAATKHYDYDSTFKLRRICEICGRTCGPRHQIQYWHDPRNGDVEKRREWIMQNHKCRSKCGSN